MKDSDQVNNNVPGTQAKTKNIEHYQSPYQSFLCSPKGNHYAELYVYYCLGFPCSLLHVCIPNQCINFACIWIVVSVIFLRLIYVDIIYYTQSVYSPGDGHLGCFQFELFWIQPLWIFLYLSPATLVKNGIVGLWGMCIPPFTMRCPAQESPWLHILAHSWYF